MALPDQCPSTLGKSDPHEHAKNPVHALQAAANRTRAAGGTTGRAYWRSLDELADTAEFRDFVEREFPAGASELLGGTTRRSFLQLMGASIALAGAATLPGCRRPDHKFLAYSKDVPEEIIPGKPLFYATSMPLPVAGAEGLLIETHEGRPTKVEGNPLHPINQGKSTIWSQASVLGIYDPDRLKFPIYRPSPEGPKEATWDDFKIWAEQNLTKFDQTQGDGLAIIAEKKSSPSRDAGRDAVLKRWPKATWIAYNAVESPAAAEGSKAAFGAPMRELLSLDKAKIIVSLDRDFLGNAEPNVLVHSRQFAATRRVLKTSDAMSRLYAIEPGFSLTGAAADHRLRLAPSQVPAFAVALAKEILPKIQAPGSQSVRAAVDAMPAPTGLDTKFLAAVAGDLLDSANHGASLVLAGDSQPPWVHALAHALNAALGNVGQTVRYAPMGEEEASSSAVALVDLAKKMSAGAINTVICLSVNPLYDAPADADFQAAFKKVTARITFSVDDTETADASTWQLNAAHNLESWGDTQAWDGTIAPIQPMIAPLYEPALSEVEFLALLGGEKAPVGYEIVRANWKRLLGAASFEKVWKRALHDGVAAGSGKPGESAQVNFGGVATALAAAKLDPAPSQQSLDVVFETGHMYDGRFANCGWLQELPQSGTRIVWDNPALISPATAKAMGLLPDPYTVKYPAGKVVTITLGGRSMSIPVWILPGIADNTVILQLGYGRKVCGLVGTGVGFNTYAVRDAANRRTARGARLEPSKTGETYPISSTQNHWTLEGRSALLREVDLVAWQKHGESFDDSPDLIYGKPKHLNFAERLGNLAHAPPNISVYSNPFNRSPAEPDPKNIQTEPGDALRRTMPPAYTQGQQWGMSIDLSTCTGCGACTIACQAENNIPIVGKKEVAKGREMAWIRVDRYFVGGEGKGSGLEGGLGDRDIDAMVPDGMVHQPVACVHCENAPCETVCPVNATVHGPEGINYMTYNRCIGTRYCANNCPYKVRRFNFFDYGTAKFNGDYLGRETVEKIAPDRGGVTGSGHHNKINVNLIPPRLRQKLDEIARMQKNPDVTVRARGVMEKCSYCIQRINYARVESKLQDLQGIPDGFFQTACQQACPTDAIVFGDILDKTTRASKMREHARSYMLLGYLNTRPRTTHMVRVGNPNPMLRKPIEDPFGEHGGGEGGHEAAPHGTGHAAEGHAQLFDSKRSRDTSGRTLSLRVLSPDQRNGHGVHA
jgi:MoCo/4Fe-4S cofactor protein with predicted Tat translocation signal